MLRAKEALKVTVNVVETTKVTIASGVLQWVARMDPQEWAQEVRMAAMATSAAARVVAVALCALRLALPEMPESDQHRRVDQ